MIALSGAEDIVSVQGQLSELIERISEPLRGEFLRCRAILSVDPKDARTRFRLGEVFCLSGMFHDALREWRRVLWDYPNHLHARRSILKVKKFISGAESEER